MKYFYTLNRTPSEYRGYEHVYLRVFARETEEQETTKTELFTLKWQGDHESYYWYGFRFEMEAHYFGDAIIRMKATQSLFQKIEKVGVQCDKIADVVKLLEDMGVTRRVYDDRESLYLTVDKIKGSEYRRWMSWLDGSCTCACLATDEDDAKRGIVKQFAHYIDEGRGFSDYAGKLEAWLAAGKPVREDSHRSEPDVRPVAEIIKPMKEPAPVELAAAA